MNTDDRAQKLYDAGFAAEEIDVIEVERMFSRGDADYKFREVDEPEKFRWFLIKKFPAKDFGVDLRWLMKMAFDPADDKQRHDRIVGLLKAGEPEWPAFVAADGTIIDGHHRIAAHRTMKVKNMPVVVAVRRRSDDLWDDLWNAAVDEK